MAPNTVGIESPAPSLHADGPVPCTSAASLSLKSIRIAFAWSVDTWVEEDFPTLWRMGRDLIAHGDEEAGFAVLLQRLACCPDACEIVRIALLSPEVLQ